MTMHRLEGTLQQRFRSGAAWTLGGAVVSRGVSLLSTLIVGRMLGPAQFGAYGTVQSTVALLGVIAALGLATATAKFVAQLRHEDPSRTLAAIVAAYALSLVASCVVAVVMLPWTGVVAARVLHDAALAGAMRWSLLLLPSSALLGVLSGVLAGQERFRPYAVLTSVRAIIAATGTVIGLYHGAVQGAIAGFAIAELVSCSLWTLRLVAEFRRLPWPAFSKCRDESGAIIAFAVPTLLSGLSVMPALWLCRVLLVQGADGYREAGLFEAANRWGTLLLFVPASLAPMQLPMLTALNAARRGSEFGALLRMIVTINVLTCTLPGIVIALGAGRIMTLYGAGYASGSRTLVIVALAATPIAVNTALGQALISQGRVWRRFGWDCALGVLLVAMAYALIPSLGATGLAIATGVAYGTVACALMAELVRRRLPVAA
jgi:O-antigen/teichoic acid export membrane protein